MRIRDTSNFIEPYNGIMQKCKILRKRNSTGVISLNTSFDDCVRDLLDPLLFRLGMQLHVSNLPASLQLPGHTTSHTDHNTQHNWHYSGEQPKISSNADWNEQYVLAGNNVEGKTQL